MVDTATLTSLNKALDGLSPNLASIVPMSGNGTTPHFTPGHSLAWYANQAIDHEQTLLGNRYLCRTGGMFLVAPSGMGKSTLSIQMAVLWCCGLPAFGIHPRKRLRILIVQSEDDQGDCTEMSQVMNHLDLTKAQKLYVEEHTELVRCNDLVGQRFVQALHSHLCQARDNGKPFDLVIINPYGVFLGDDVKNTTACTRFLNELLNPVLNELGVATILIHHTPKTNFQNTDKYKLWDWMYWGAGCASITNWARAILVIKPEGDDMQVFKFIAAKRGGRIGTEWADSFIRHFAWSSVPGVLRWELASSDQIAGVAAITNPEKAPKEADLDIALDQVPMVDARLKPDVIRDIAKACDVGIVLAKEALNKLIVAGHVINKPIPNPHGARSLAGVMRSCIASDYSTSPEIL
jgi:AAA domain